MTAEAFCYWLQGHFELGDDNLTLTAAQGQIVRQHLALVFKHDIDPKAGGPEKQKMLNDLHNGPNPDGGPAYRC